MSIDPATAEQFEAITWGDVQDGDRVIVPDGDGRPRVCEVARKGSLYAITLPDGRWSPPGAVPPEIPALRLVRGAVSSAITMFGTKGMELENIDD